MITVEYYYDLASPNCYMANKALADILNRTDAQVRYIPVLLGGIFKATNNQAPWITYAPVESKMKFQSLMLHRFVKKHNLNDYQMNPNFPINTILIQRGMVAASLDSETELVQYIEAGQKLMWEQGAKMDDPEVFVRGFTEHGLDGQRLLNRTQDQDVKDALRSNTEQAVSRGVFGAPTFFVGDEMFFGKDQLPDVEDEIRNSNASY